jgi:uncharacterized protein YrrD
MLHSLKSLNGFVVHATDGKIGHVEDCYFDDEHWTVRYLVVNTGSWLLGRRVLISPAAVSNLERRHHAVHVNLTREQVENSPDIDTARPISRRQEAGYAGYFGWPIYWTGGMAWGAAAYPGLVMAPAARMVVEEQVEERETAAETEEDSHLRSSREVTGYGVLARDGEIGHVEDFLVDDRTWTIRYIAVDPKNFWPGPSVLIPPQWLTSVTWSAAKVRVDHTRDEIRQAPEWNPSEPISREFEARLYEHYRRQGYWEEEEQVPDRLAEEPEPHEEHAMSASS